MAEPLRIRDIRVRVDPATVDALSDAALRVHILARLPGHLDRETAEATATELAATIRGVRRRSS